MANSAPANVTITSSTGPGQAVTALAISNVVDVEYDFAKNTVRVMTSDGKLQYFDYSAVATVTQVISGGSTTITIS